MTSMARLFNTAVIKERVNDLAQEMTRNELGRTYSVSDANIGNIMAVRDLLLQTQKSSHSPSDKTFSLKYACQYLYRSGTLNRRQCAIVLSIIGYKRFASYVSSHHHNNL